MTSPAPARPASAPAATITPIMVRATEIPP
jgi:hypothetical protein